MSQWLVDACERGRVPDAAIRFGIRRLLAGRLKREQSASEKKRQERFGACLRKLRAGPIAVATDAANTQHYELPAAFFEQVLGRHMKYSSAWWDDGVRDLDDAEAAMLALSAERAELEDGQQVLELGCGWGALTLWIAANFPGSRITALSNSTSQREFIEHKARALGLTNVEVVTADINDFDTERRFDRVVSLEMFEHMRNYEELMARIARWLRPEGKLFVHIFCHRELMYPFEDEGRYDWMARNFFTGGLMPAANTLQYFQDALALEAQWEISGRHYEQTSEAWLAKLDRARPAVLEAMTRTYGERDARLWLQRWRMFFMACAELFGYRGGREWQVAHYRFRRRTADG